MPTPATDHPSRPLPGHVAVIGAAGGLGQGIVKICRAEGIGFTAIVRSRPERITEVPGGAYQDASTLLETNGLRGGSPPYAVILGYLSLKKAGKPAAARSFMQNWIKQFDPAAWTTKIMKYLNGEMTSARILALATDNDKLTEAHGHIGEMLLIAGDRTNAGLHFKWVRDRGVKTFSEFNLAIAKLNRILPAKPVK